MNLPASPPYGFRGLDSQARDALRGLTSLHVCAGVARGFEASSQRIAHRQSEAPRGVVVGEYLAKRVTKTATARTGDEPRETTAAPKELRPGWGRRIGLLLAGSFFMSIAVLTTLDSLGAFKS